jgi:pimeloyl-ACP methyl ester carboxylesterase
MTAAKKKFIKAADGTGLYYETFFNADLRPKIFLLHGIGGDVDAWKQINDIFLAAGFSTIAMDLRGHGHSGHPRNSDSYLMKNFTADIQAVIDAENLNKIILIGHSYGAVIAAHFATLYPQRLEKLILISTIFRPPSFAKSPILKSMSLGFVHLASSISPGPLGRKRHSIYPPGKIHKDYEWWGLTKTLLRNSWASYLLGTKEIINLDLEMKLDQIQVPTLMIAGDKDTVATIAIAQKMQAKVPGAKLRIIPGGNHVLVLNNAAEVANLIIEFL